MNFFPVQKKDEKIKEFNRNFDLNELRYALIRMEDTIIFALIERAQFSHNSCIYNPDPTIPNSLSFLDYLLHEMEVVHAKVRRYTSPDENPFTSDLPTPILPPLSYPSFIQKNSINFNGRLKALYLNEIVPRICSSFQDDSNYGSSATRDVECLQAISKRIHYGKFIAEAKFQDLSTRHIYVDLIRKKDRTGILNLLTNITVEEKLLQRVKKKATIYGQDLNIFGEIDSKDTKRKLSPDIVVELYQDHIIPLTKEVEVEYLLQRNVDD
jgi:chorismate mutase